MKSFIRILAITASLAFSLGDPSKIMAAKLDSISHQPWGKTHDGQPVDIYTLRNANGCVARITNYGGIVVSLTVPDRHGHLGDVILGNDSLATYVKDNGPYLGALIGRFGNRIAHGRFTLDGRQYQLAINNPPNHLHGGLRGFDKRVWDAKPMMTSHGPTLELHYLSRDGEENYPGNLDVTAVYTLTDHNELKVEFSAKTDRDTIVNLTHHPYFNLAGPGHGTILDHEVTINASKFIPIDETAIPTGEIRAVEGTPFDFRKPMKIGARIHENDQQLKFGTGYDHTFVIRHCPLLKMSSAAKIYEPTSGREVEIFTTEPGMQFYSGNHLDGTIVGKGGIPHKFRTGVAVEAQHFPDSPNHSNFPSTVLKPGQTFKSTILYRFTAK